MRAPATTAVTCGLCGHQTSVAMIVEHLVRVHGYARDELEQAIQDAPIIIELDDDDDR